MGLSFGLAISSMGFSGGEISAKVEFDQIGPGNSCELIFFFDPTRRTHVHAGIGGFDSAFCIRHWDGANWQTHASTGSRASLRARTKYSLRVKVLGSRVTLLVDHVEVLGAILPFRLPPSQTGLFCLDDANIRVSQFEVDSRRAKVFVVMQFTTPFNEIHEEVVKKICAEFGLEAHRADETYGPGMIVADVAREIAEAEFIIAEITPPNPNVYYELGYSHAINKPVIMLADKTIEKLPFDVSPFRVLFYDNSIAGRRHFEDGLRQHIRAIRSAEALPVVTGAGITRR